MTNRSGFLTSLATLLAALLFAPLPIARAEDATQEIENSKYQAEGKINSNAVYIRSGASDNDYPTIKLDRGASVTVVGVKFDWLKIVPPEGSYCYVAKAYVEKRGDGTVGRVTNPLNVRVGSALNAMKTKVAARLDVGDDVKVLGEQDEYFKIAPPKSVYLYVNKQYVDVVKTVDVAKATPKPDPIPAPLVKPDPEKLPQPLNDQTATNPGNNTGNNTAGGDTIPAPIKPETPEPDQTASQGPATNPATPKDVAIEGPPATKPVDAQAAAEEQFDSLERTFIENDRKTIDQQPLAQLQAGYEKVIASNALPESLRRMSEYRLTTVKQRLEDQQKYIQVKKNQEEMRARQQALQAEREELEGRIKASGVKYYAALGTLRVSSLQQGGGTLYRLTDPKTGRTVVYVRTEDAKIGQLIGQFIGVSGTVQTEQAMNLKVVTPTGFEAVDQSKVNITIAAEVIPPSMMPIGTNTASVGRE